MYRIPPPLFYLYLVSLISLAPIKTFLPHTQVGSNYCRLSPSRRPLLISVSHRGDLHFLCATTFTLSPLPSLSIPMSQAAGYNYRTKVWLRWESWSKYWTPNGPLTANTRQWASLERIVGQTFFSLRAPFLDGQLSEGHISGKSSRAVRPELKVSRATDVTLYTIAYDPDTQKSEVSTLPPLNTLPSPTLYFFENVMSIYLSIHLLYL